MVDQSFIDLTGILDNLEKIFTIFAIIIGGIWAYFNFFKSRIYRIRLEPTISGKVIEHNKNMFLKVKLQIRNAGSSKVNIEQKGSGFRLNAYQLNNVKGSSQSADKKHLKTYSMFKSHRWVESRETIVEEQLIAISNNERFAFELEMRVVAHKISFKTNCIVEVQEKNNITTQKRNYDN